MIIVRSCFSYPFSPIFSLFWRFQISSDDDQSLPFLWKRAKYFTKSLSTWQGFSKLALPFRSLRLVRTKRRAARRTTCPKLIHDLCITLSTYPPVFDLRPDTCSASWLQNINFIFTLPLTAYSAHNLLYITSDTPRVLHLALPNYRPPAWPAIDICLKHSLAYTRFFFST